MDDLPAASILWHAFLFSPDPMLVLTGADFLRIVSINRAVGTYFGLSQEVTSKLKGSVLSKTILGLSDAHQKMLIHAIWASKTTVRIRSYLWKYKCTPVI